MAITITVVTALQITKITVYASSWVRYTENKGGVP